MLCSFVLCWEVLGWCCGRRILAVIELGWRKEDKTVVMNPLGRRNRNKSLDGVIANAIAMEGLS